MNEDAFKTIQSLFDSKEIETINFSKNYVSVKWLKEKDVRNYTYFKVAERILEDLEMYEKEN